MDCVLYLFEARRFAWMGNQGNAVANDGDVFNEDAKRRVFVGRHLDDVDVELAEKLRQGQMLRPGFVQCYFTPCTQRQRDSAEDCVCISMQRHARWFCVSLAEEQKHVNLRRTIRDLTRFDV